MALFAAALLAFVALVGCSNPSSPDPEPEPDPVKVYLTGTESFTRVDAAGTIAMTDIYQWDTDADGSVDSPAAYFTGANIAVNFDNSRSDCFILTAGSTVYLNTALIGTQWHCDGVAGDFALAIVDSKLVYDWGTSGTEPFDAGNCAYNADGTLTIQNYFYGQKSIHPQRPKLKYILPVQRFFTRQPTCAQYLK